MGCTRSKSVSTTEAIVDRYSHDLFLIAGSGDVSRLSSLLRELDKHHHGHTRGGLAARKELLNGGYVEADGLTALSIAAGKKHKHLTQVLAEMVDVDVNRASSSGITALLMVAEVGWSDVLRTLLGRGADVNASPTGKRAESAKIAGSTPLIGATKYNHPECVDLLLAHGASADHQNASGISALMLAAEQGYSECVRLLVEAGRADLELAPSGEAALSMNLSGQTPLFCAAKEGHLDIVEYLLGRGANADAINHYGVSVLWIPSQRGFESVVRTLAQHTNTELAPFGAEADDRNIAGWTPLYVAMKSRRFDVARVLLEHGANPNAVTKLGSTPFLLASEVADIDMIRFFVEKGAALDAAPSGPEADRLNITGQTPIFMATLKERANVVQFLIGKGADVNVQNRYGVSPLLLCAENGNLEIVQMLVKAGADPNICPAGPLAEQHLLAGQTPLIGAAKRAHTQICAFLVEHAGADIDHTTLTGVTALYTAVEEGRTEIAETLLAYGADPDIAPIGKLANELKIEKQTPLLVACMKNFEAVSPPGGGSGDHAHCV